MGKRHAPGVETMGHYWMAGRKEDNDEVCGTNDLDFVNRVKPIRIKTHTMREREEEGERIEPVR